MSKTSGAWSPEAKAKAAATRAANKAAKAAQTDMPLEAIPDRAPKKTHSKKDTLRKNNLVTIRALLTTALALLEQM